MSAAQSADDHPISLPKMVRQTASLVIWIDGLKLRSGFLFAVRVGVARPYSYAEWPSLHMGKGFVIRVVAVP